MTATSPILQSTLKSGKEDGRGVPLSDWHGIGAQGLTHRYTYGYLILVLSIFRLIAAVVDQ